MVLAQGCPGGLCVDWRGLHTEPEDGLGSVRVGEGARLYVLLCKHVFMFRLKCM